MKLLVLSFASLLTFSSVTSANTVVSNTEQAAKIPGVKKLKEKDDGSYKVKCANKSKGTISREETNICVFSKDNGKNRCDDEVNWTIEEAAEFICK